MDMILKHDWRHIEHLADQLTSQQVAEMFAIHRAMIGSDERLPIMDFHFVGDVFAPLVTKELVEDEYARLHDYRPGWVMPILTLLGVRVLMRVAERAMLATGAMVETPTQQEDHA